MRFTKYLEAITNSQYLTAVISKLNNTLHHGAKPSDCTTSQIIAIRESARQHNVRTTLEVAVLMPKLHCFLLHDVAKHVHHVFVTIGSRENYNAEFHLEWRKRKGTKSGALWSCGELTI